MVVFPVAARACGAMRPLCGSSTQLQCMYRSAGAVCMQSVWLREAAVGSLLHDVAGTCTVLLLGAQPASSHARMAAGATRTFMTKASLTDTHAMVSTPLPLMSSAFSMKPAYPAGAAIWGSSSSGKRAHGVLAAGGCSSVVPLKAAQDTCSRRAGPCTTHHHSVPMPLSSTSCCLRAEVPLCAPSGGAMPPPCATGTRPMASCGPHTKVTGDCCLPGKCFKLQVGVKAPGTANKTTFLFLHICSMDTSFRLPSPSKYLSFWSPGNLHVGTRAPTCQVWTGTKHTWLGSCNCNVAQGTRLRELSRLLLLDPRGHFARCRDLLVANGNGFYRHGCTACSKRTLSSKTPA